MAETIRKAFVLRLKPGALDQYIYWHDNIWPELQAGDRRAGHRRDHPLPARRHDLPHLRRSTTRTPGRGCGTPTSTTAGRELMIAADALPRRRRRRFARAARDLALRPRRRAARPMAIATAYDVVIVGAGSAGCALANRLSADPSVSVAAARSGRLGRPRGDPHPPPVLLPLGHRRRLAVRLHAAAGHGGPHPRHAARPRARRHQQHQRHGLPARRGVGLRRLGRRRLRRAGTGTRCARRSRSSRTWLRPAVLQPHNPLSAGHGRGGRRGRLSAQPDVRQRHPRRRRLEQIDDRRRRAAQRLSRVPRAGPATGRTCDVLPEHARRCAWRSTAGAPRGVVVQRDGGRTRDDRRRRGDRLRRRVRFAAAADALRASAPPARARAVRHRAGRRPAGGREPDRPPADRGRLRLAAADLRPQRATAPRAARSPARRRTARTATSRSPSHKEPHFAPETNDGAPRYTIIPGHHAAEEPRHAAARPRPTPTRRSAIDPELLRPPRRHGDDDRGRAPEPAHRRAGRVRRLERAASTSPAPPSRPTSRSRDYVERATSAPGSTRRHVPHGHRRGRGGRSRRCGCAASTGLRVADASIMPDSSRSTPTPPRP